MFIAALLTKSHAMKITQILTADEWIKKMSHIHTMEFYPAIKKNKIMYFERQLRQLENIMLSEVSHAWKNKVCMFLSYV
jgi:hypothetical protein